MKKIITQRMAHSKRYGERVRAYVIIGDDMFSAVNPWSEMLVPESNHERVAHVLAHKLKWDGPLGVTLTKEPLENGFVFTVVE